MIPPAWPLSPFEVFRTPITIRRFTQGFYLNGQWQEGSQVTLSTVLITGNVVNITLNGVALSPITFTTSASVTMALIQAALLAQPNILQVDISIDNLTITIVPWQPNLSFVNSFTVTGGASQPTITILNSPFLIQATSSVQPIKGRELDLVPEGRRDSDVFTMFTSTEIYDLTTQNPDQVTIAKAPYTNTVFEVIQLHEWQNNSTFNIVNHYKFIMIKLHPLP
jgi:hypothetical protein